MTYTAAVVGAGMGGKLSIQALAASKRFRLVAVADLREEVRHELEVDYPGICTFGSHLEMFGQCPTDVVCVSSWPPSHLGVTRDALGLPLKGMLIEKPLGHNYTAGREVLDSVRARDLPLVVPHGLLVTEHVRQIIDLVDHERIGNLKLVEIQHNGWDLFNAGIHWLNFFVTLTHGESIDFVMACCDARTRTYRDGMQVETLGVTYAQTRTGIRLVMTTGDYVKISHEGTRGLFRLIGTDGFVEFYGWPPRYRLLNKEFPQGKVIEVEPGPQTGHERYLESLADQIDFGKPDYAIPESSLAALEICEAAYLSSKYQCAVQLPLSRFVPPQPTDWELGKPYGGHGGGRDGRHLPPLADAWSPQSSDVAKSA